MSVAHFGDYDTTETVNIPFNTFDSNDPTASVTITNLAAGDIEIHKDGNVVQRSSDAGVTVSINFDGITGNHMIHIDLSDNTDAGFYAAGSRYQVRIEGVTVDAGTLNSWVGAFSVGCTLRPTTAGNTLDVSATGEAGLDFDNIKDATGAHTLTNITVPVVTTNTDMVGTDSAALAATALTDATWTDARAGYLDELAAANLPADLDSVITLIGTPADTDVSTDIVNLQTGIDTIQTVGAAINEPVVASPGGFVLSTGINEVLTEDATSALDGSTHEWDSTGNAMDGRYLLNIGGAYVPVSFSLHGKLSGSVGDAVLVKANTGTIAAPVWVTRGSIVRTNPATLLPHSFILFPSDLMTGVDAGKVQIQIVNDGAVTAATMIVDQLYVSKSLSASTTGYANGAIWVDTVNGTAGTVEDVNGTADNPVDSIADANTIAAVTSLNRFYIMSGSSITFAASQEGQQFDGCNWTLALGGQSISGTQINCADVTGIGTGATIPSFQDCHLNGVTLPPCHVEECGLIGTFTLGSAGTFYFDTCHSGVAGQSSPHLDFGAALNASDVNFRRYSGGIELENMGAGTGTYNMSLEGDGQYILNANCSATSNLSVRGHFDETDNAGGAVTVTNTAAFHHNAIIDNILTDTATTIPALIAALNDISSANVNTEVAAALGTYDGPTRTEATADKDEVIVQVNANETKIDTIDGIVDAILVDTATTIPAQIAALNNISVANILAGVVEGTITIKQSFSLMLSVLTGKSSGGGTNTITFRDTADAKDRVVATVDANQDRTAITTRDGS